MTALAASPGDEFELLDAERAEFKLRRFLLRTKAELMQLVAALRFIPLDAARPLEVLIQEQEEGRGLSANALMWAGPLHDIEQQAWMVVDGVRRRFRAEVWHEYFKREYLPERPTPGMTRKGYAKWAMDPSNNRVMVGSTTMLTKKGFAEYLTQIEAHGASLGVMYHANPNELPALPY